MKKRGFIVIAMLLVTSLMAALGTGAIDLFTAKRAAAMNVVTDSSALISLVGDGLYATEKSNGELKLDFTDGAFIGQGFNPQSNSEFNDVFTVTNQSAKTVYVWLEAIGWSSQHNGGLQYRIEDTNGAVTNVNAWYGNTQPYGKNLLDSTGMNFTNGVGKNAYVQLDPGEYFSVKVLVNTVLSNGYGDANTPYSNWSHTVIVKANTTAPTQN